MRYTFPALITAAGDTPEEARNKILKLLAYAELQETILYFNLSHEGKLGGIQ